MRPDDATTPTTHDHGHDTASCLDDLWDFTWSFDEQDYARQLFFALCARYARSHRPGGYVSPRAALQLLPAPPPVGAGAARTLRSRPRRPGCCASEARSAP